MDIEFLGPAVPVEDGGISFRAKVDGETVACEFSMEALQDVDPALTTAAPGVQFESRQRDLLEIAERKIRTGHMESGVVRVFTKDL